MISSRVPGIFPARPSMGTSASLAAASLIHPGRSTWVISCNVVHWIVLGEDKLANELLAVIFDLTLHHYKSTQSLSFVWDSETGELRGPDADIALDNLNDADESVRLDGSWPQMDAKDPLHTPASFALIFAAEGYSLPAKLAKFLPDLDDDTPEGAVN